MNFQSIIKFLFIFLIIGAISGYPLVAAISSIFDISSSVFSVAFRASIAICSILCIIFSMRAIQPVSNTQVLMFFILFLYSMRLFFETFFRPEILSQDPSYYWFLFLGSTVLPTTAIILTKQIAGTKTLTTLIMTLLIVALIIFYKISFVNNNIYGFNFAGRGSLEKLNPISVSDVGGSLILLCTWSLFASEFGKKKNMILLLFGFLFGLYTLLIGASKGPIVSTAISLLLLLMSQKFEKKNKILFSIIVILLITYVGNSGDFFNFHSLSYRFQNALSGGDESSLERVELWKFGFTSIISNPFLGSGIEVRELRFYPHNFFIEMFMAIGIFGGILSVLLFASISTSGLRLLFRKHSTGWSTLIFFQYFIGSMFSGSVYSNSIVWVSAAFVTSSWWLLKKSTRAV